VYIVFFLVTLPDRAAPALFLCPLAHPDRSLSLDNGGFYIFHEALFLRCLGFIGSPLK